MSPISNETSPDERLRWLAEQLNSKRQPVIVDIGANRIETPTYDRLKNLGLCEVVGFEPQTDPLNALMATHGANERYLPHALGNGEEITFREYRESGLSSAFQIDHASLAYLGRSRRAVKLVQETPMATQRLDDLADISHVDVLKIDVQGSEAAIIANGTNKLANAIAVIVEIRFFPLYNDEPLFDAVAGQILELGLAFHKFLFVKSTSIANSQAARMRTRRLKNQAIDGDAVFIADLRQPDRVDDARLKHLALIADAVLSSVDLCVHCIDLLAARGAVPPETAARYVDRLPREFRRD